MLALVLTLFGWRRLGATGRGARDRAAHDPVLPAGRRRPDAFRSRTRRGGRGGGAGLLLRRHRRAGRRHRAGHPPEQPMPDLTDGADRIWHAARLFHRGPGAAHHRQRRLVPRPAWRRRRPTEAEAMRVFLIDLGVPADAIVDEGKALNTIENIRNVRAMVGDGPRRAGDLGLSHAARAAAGGARPASTVGAFPTDYQVVAGGRACRGTTGCRRSARSASRALRSGKSSP